MLPKVSFQNESGMSWSRYTPVVSMTPLARYSVDPAANTKIIRPTAMTMLMKESHLIPVSSPVATEITAMRVTMPIRMIWVGRLSSRPNSTFSPLLICMVPRPMVTATPKRVPRTAKMSTKRPTGPLMPSPRNGWRIELTRKGSPLR